MPVWTVTLSVNVPGTGASTVDIEGIDADTIEQATNLARQAVIVVPIAAHQTAVQRTVP
jgi:hypothetical protein